MKAINDKLKVVNIRAGIRLLDARTWQFAFELEDTRRSRKITDINSLSGGQKAIIHLVFEAYGRGDLKGGVVIIDEPEIHLHYQFQHEYLRVINDLNSEQMCQYIVVTHSEALINSSTINSVRRFALNPSGHTQVYAPTLTADQKSLIRILDNTRSTYAFFAKKVVLVEGDTDRFFYRAALLERYPSLDQEIAVLHVGGKNEFPKWQELFTSFGLGVWTVADFDYILELHYVSQRGTSLKKDVEITNFKKKNPDWEQKIDSEYANGMCVLKEGALEAYSGVGKDLSDVIAFCQNDLQAFLKATTPKSVEMRSIIDLVAL